MEFGADYYAGIWGTVHRHDYAPSLAHVLVREYGKVRILDIGTGCGHLVACLRDLGCEAWGIEISDHALANSCSSHVLRGDIRKIPFPDGFFDVVHSQGVWGYFPESDIPGAWAECRRVGRKQHHNIDYDDDEPSHQLLLAKPKSWWDEKLAWPKILVGTSTHRCKEYSFQRWIDRVKSFTYPHVEILAVDNSEDTYMVDKYGPQIPMIHIPGLPQSREDYHFRITRSMAALQKTFLAGNYTRWFNLECDVIPPSDIIEQMLHWGRDSDWIAFSYPNRECQSDVQQGIGCALLSRAIASAFDYIHADSPDAWLWENVRKAKRFRTAEFWQYADVQHLAS